MARLTPAGRGAVAVVGLCGPAALEALDACFDRAAGTAVQQIAEGRIVFGRWRSRPAAAGEDVVVARLAGEHWEIHCHGGEAAVAAILESLAAQGAVHAEPTEWCVGESHDALTAAAFAAWPLCLTDRTSALLAALAGGALRQACLRTGAVLMATNDATNHSRALADAVTHDSQSAGSGACEPAIRQLDELLARAPYGLRLTRPWQVALVGRPNAGKSSLINRIVGYERAIGSPIPGTTRDVVAATTAWQGWRLRFADTAGVRSTDDGLEAAGIARSLASHASADLTLHVVDLSQPWTEEDDRLTHTLHTRPSIVVHNKSDLVNPPLAAALAVRPRGVVVSARTGDGVEPLLDAIVARLIPDPPAPHDPLPFTEAIAATLRDTRRLVAEGDLAAAVERLGEWLRHRPSSAAEHTLHDTR